MRRVHWWRVLGLALILAPWPLIVAAVAVVRASEPPSTAALSTAPLLQDARLPVWNAVARAYWTGQPDVENVDACGPGGPMVRHVDYWPARGTAWSDGACSIWFEDAYLAALRSMPAWLAGRDGCLTYVHEFGHALGQLGSPSPLDDHSYAADPMRVMSEHVMMPDQCASAFPSPPEPTARLPRARCVPMWAARSTRAIQRDYRAGRRSRARASYRRWARSHRERAERMIGFGICRRDPWR